jgi:hypothetical protein
MIAHVIGLPISNAQYKDYKALEQAYAARKNDKQRFTYVDSGIPASSNNNSASENQIKKDE